jgi:hypothetical protein
MDEYDEEALRADANDKWQPWSLTLENWKLRLSELTFTEADFSVAPGSPELFDLFSQVRTGLQDYIHAGEETFEGIARALLDSVTRYMEMEGYAQDKIDQVERERDAL